MTAIVTGGKRDLNNVYNALPKSFIPSQITIKSKTETDIMNIQQQKMESFEYKTLIPFIVHFSIGKYKIM